MSGSSSSALCGLFVARVPVSGASITMFRDTGAQSTIGVSDVLSARLDQLQFDLGEGPRWETARTGRPSGADDVRQYPHVEWPVFGAAAAELGVGALFSFPIRMGNQLLGVADLYRHEPGGLGRDATARALSVTREVAGAAVDAASRAADSTDEASSGAAGFRREVHQAIGMILMQLDVDAAEAFAVLRGYAFSHELSVDDVAREIVARRMDFLGDPIQPDRV